MSFNILIVHEKGVLAISFFIIIGLGLVVATVIDLHSRRIPNWLTVNLSMVGLANSLWVKGWSGLGEHIVALLIGLIIFFVFYLLNIFGAGDAKMMAALGAIMGIPFIIYASFIVVFVGGIISFILLMKKRGLPEIWLILLAFLKALFSKNVQEFRGWVNDASKNTFPFSIAITIGSVITLWYLYPNL